MKDGELHRAFGETPERVRSCVRSALDGPQEEYIMKKRISLGLAVALIVLAVAGGVAAARYGVLDFLSWQDESGKRHVNAALPQAVQAVNAVYDGKAVRMEITDALYDKEGGVYTIAWTMENKTDGDRLYIVCDDMKFDGEYAHARSYGNLTEFFLEEGEVQGGLTGELPENSRGNAVFSFSTLKPLAEIVPFRAANEDEAPGEYEKRARAIIDAGKIPVAGDGVIEYAAGGLGDTYTEALLDSGMFELADQFTLSFTLEEDKMTGLTKTFVDEGSYVFTDYELRVRRAETTPMAVKVEVEYFTAEKPADGGKGMGPLWELQFSVPGMDDLWYSNAGGWWEEPLKLDDGRWLSVFCWEAVDLKLQPDAIEMTLVTYEMREDVAVPTVHEEDTVTIRFE